VQREQLAELQAKLDQALLNKEVVSEEHPAVKEILYRVQQQH
jgi:hypothetical protein